ncbi:MAG: helix-turn-helix domain-containing protein [Clostridia bacterium]|nr:helix-turn-helix domain-containing protein [Clostridia bacterium]
MDIVRVFGTNLRRLRTEKGYSQEKFAELCGLHRTYISDIECFTRNISIENVQKIADALDINAYKLFIYFEEDNNEANK